MPQFVEPKTKQSRRTFALADNVVKALRKQRKAQLEERLLAGTDWKQSGLLFTTRTGRPLDGVNVTRDFKRMLKRAGLPVRRFHDLWHTTASLFALPKGAAASGCRPSRALRDSNDNGPLLARRPGVAARSGTTDGYPPASREGTEKVIGCQFGGQTCPGRSTLSRIVGFTSISGAGART
jgi:hypothetical protein